MAKHSSVLAPPFLLLFFFCSSCISSPPAPVMAPAPAPAPSSSRPDMVEEACHIGWQDRPQYAQCVAALRSSPESRNATLLDLAVLSMTLALRDAVAVLKHMQTMQSRGVGDATYRKDLSNCLDDYRHAISDMETYIRCIRKDSYDGAVFCVWSADNYSSCGQDFAGEGEDPVMAQRDEIIVLFFVASNIPYKYCKAKHLNCDF